LLEGSIPLVFEQKPNSNEYDEKLMVDPFMRLRPCMTFKDMDWRSDFITIEEILPELESKLEEYGKKDEKVDH